MHSQGWNSTKLVLHNMRITLSMLLRPFYTISFIWRERVIEWTINYFRHINHPTALKVRTCVLISNQTVCLSAETMHQILLDYSKTSDTAPCWRLFFKKSQNVLIYYYSCVLSSFLSDKMFRFTKYT